MNRKQLLRGAGMLGLGLTLPKSKSGASTRLRSFNGGDQCILIPSETAGPFPLDLTENNTFFRQDVRETEDGIELTLRMRIVGLENCLPMPNVRVNIWHCNKDGLYSGYNGNNNPNQEGLTYCRGYQFTDAEGEVEFTTILPGWYNGRICHIHFQVYVNSSYAAISQLSFPIDTKNAVYAANSDLYTKGADPLNFSQDGIFADGHEYQLATLEDDPDTGGLKSFLEVAVQGSGVVGVSYIESEINKIFELGQNFPNPHGGKTTIPFTIKEASDVKLEIWSMDGRRLATVLNERLSAGDYAQAVDLNTLNLPSANYMYQLEAVNSKGTFRLPKVMTAVK